MKLLEPKQTPQVQDTTQIQQPSYFVWEQHNVTLIRSSQYGYGVAISGGLSNHSEDASIIVTDIVPDGPAEGKLCINDKLLSVNGVNVENVEHSFVIRLLKEAKEFIHLVIKRKINDIYNSKAALLKQQEAEQTAPIQQSGAGNISTIKRCNQAIIQTANTILANFNHTDPAEAVTQDQMTTTTVPLLKPIKVTLNRKDKKTDGFGVILGCKYYIKDILPDTLAAHEANLRKGDILLKLNDLSTDQLSLCEAKKMLVKSTKLTLSVKRNSLASSSSDSEELSETNDPPSDQIDAQIISVPAPTNDYQVQEELKAKLEEVPIQISSKQLFKPINNNCNGNNNANQRVSKFYSNKSVPMNFRTIRFARENGIGIRLAGGNKVGIFICDVQYNSPAERAGLKIADKIMKVNGTDYSALTREEAVHHILMIQNTIEMVVALCQEEYEQYAFDPMGGDSFYIRAHFNYTSQTNVDLSFKINDILHVTDTLYNGVMGQWVATKLNDQSINSIVNGHRAPPVEAQSRGTIPNQTNAEQLVTSAQTIDELCQAQTASTTQQLNLHSIGASARMSIRKKLARSALASKRSKSASRSNANSDTDEPVAMPASKSTVKVSKANTFCGSKYPAYERVVLKEVNFIRPVVVFGALSDVARDRLRQELPAKFAIPESYSTEASSQSAGVIKLASIKSIIDKSQHCLLDITPNAVEHLNYAQYFPICVFLHAESHGHVKELRHKYAKTMKVKSSKRLYENAQRLSTFYSHLFTESISLEQGQWFKKLKEVIECQQSQPLWISQELDELLVKTNEPQQQQQQPNYELNAQQQQFMAKQDQLQRYQQQQMNMHSNFDDNFELPMYTGQQAFPGAISGAASTYSLYEDQNYRSSFAASDSDIGPAVASSSYINNNTLTNQNQPIYSTNFNTNPQYKQSHNNYSSAVEHSTPHNVNNTAADIDHSISRFKSDSNLINNYESNNSQFNTKYATYNPNHRNALIQKTNNYEQSSNQNQRRLSTNSDYMSMNNGAPAPPSQPPRPNYKLIKNSSQSTLMPAMQSAIIDNSLHYADLNESQGTNNRSLLQPIQQQHQQQQQQQQNQSQNQSQNNESLVEKLNSLKMEKMLAKQQSEQALAYEANNASMTNYFNHNHQQHQSLSNKCDTNSTSNDCAVPVKRPSSAGIKKEAPAKPPPPTLPKPKFNLPQSSVTNLVLQRNLKAKSELNIATPSSTYVSSSSSSSGASSTSSSKDIINTNSPDADQQDQIKKTPIDVHHIPAGITKMARNKFLENNSLVSSSHGYHSDTWESHSSRQSFELDNVKESAPDHQPLPPSRYKTFNKSANLVTDSKLAMSVQKQQQQEKEKQALKQRTDTTGSTSDGSLNGISGDDTDSIPHGYKTNGQVEKKKASSSSSSSASSSASCSSTSSAAAISAATTLSSHSTNSFSAAVQALQAKANENNVGTITKCNISQSRSSAIELPIYYQTTNNTSVTTTTTGEDNTLSKSIMDDKTSSSMNNSNNSYTDLYTQTNEALKYSRPSGNTYTAHYNDSGVYRKLSLDSNSNCSIIASANGIFDSNGGILESADTGVSINVPEGAIANGYSFDLYFKVCHCKSNITNGKGELLSNPIVMCGPRGVKFLKPIELQIPHFISIDGQSWSYAFKTSDLDDSFNFGRFQKKTLLNSVTVNIDGF